jgi:hypothetical protein
VRRRARNCGVILAATIGFATIVAIAVLVGVGVPANMQMALPVNITKQRRLSRGAHLL